MCLCTATPSQMQYTSFRQHAFAYSIREINSIFAVLIYISFIRIFVWTFNEKKRTEREKSTQKRTEKRKTSPIVVEKKPKWKRNKSSGIWILLDFRVKSSAFSTKAYLIGFFFYHSLQFLTSQWCSKMVHAKIYSHENCTLHRIAYVCRKRVKTLINIFDVW